MTLTTKTLSKYLGEQASALLGDLPFINWVFERSVETDLDAVLTDYVFHQDGMDFVCDEEGRVNSIFLYADETRYFKEGVQDLPFASSREDVIARLGSPSKSGGRVTDPILGEYGAWDQFSLPGYVIHVEYRLGVDVINKVTLMRADVAP
jgi:hypothetical protein